MVPTVARESSNSIRTVGVVGNHVPRQCGIATFTADLGDALTQTFPGLECTVLAMNEPGRTYAYPPRVRFEVAEPDLASYRRGADFLNVNPVDVVSLQHEYGIFGGKAGSHVVTLLRGLRAPIVTTLHTVLARPDAHQRATMDDIVKLSDRVVVMSEHGADLLREVHAVPAHKIDVIHHGIPDLPAGAGDKERLGIAGRDVILTFGLLSPDKGVEQVIEALPAILARHPHATYVVVGATHPHVREVHGETYRYTLEDRAERLGVSASVIFHDRFVSALELAQFMGAADIYVTPYLKVEQITSGTLAYAVGCGKAVISTPYWYARELLADGRGVLVPSRDPQAIARAVNDLLDDPVKTQGLRARAAAYGMAMRWPVVAQRYMDAFERAREGHAERRRAFQSVQTLAHRPVELPEVRLGHLHTLTDETGMLQHATFDVPNYADGYCLDDNARAMIVTTLLDEAGTQNRAEVRGLTARYLAFVQYAFDPARRRFRNFLGYDRQWVAGEGSEDSHGRALWALGTLVGHANHPGRKSLASNLFRAALPAVVEFTSPRAWAYALLGVEEYLQVLGGDIEVQSVQAILADLLHRLYQRVSDTEWPWFEDQVTYCNARLSQALIVSGARLLNLPMRDAGLRSLDWLAGLQRADDGAFAPIGSNGFYVRGAPRAYFDQQPVEACAMVSACLDAGQVTGDRRWAVHARRAFNWFLGQNHLQQNLYDPATGGCRDGLHTDRVNENQGAESTLSFLQALIAMRGANRVHLAASTEAAQ